MTGVPFLSAEDVTRALPPAAAVDAVRQALLSGVDPADDPPRDVVPMGSGQLLVMPSASVQAAGVKLVTVAPGNPAVGLPRIQGMYLLVEPRTLTPTAILDGTALTALRTPAVSVAAVLPALLRNTEPLRVVLFGAGPQAVAHVLTLADTLAGRRQLGPLTVVTRQPGRTPPGLLAAPDARALAPGGAELDPALGQADLVVCATTARAPLFDSRLLPDRCVIVAIGSHEPDAREVDSALAGRSQVIVEDATTALREAGDVVRAVADGSLDPSTLVPLRDAVRGDVAYATDRPVLFKSTGMAWEDLAVAAAVLEAWSLLRSGRDEGGR